MIVKVSCDEGRITSDAEDRVVETQGGDQIADSVVEVRERSHHWCW